MVKLKFDVYGLGQCAWDYIGQIEKYPSSDSKCEVSDMVTQGGGPVATALVALTRWGFSCSFCGVIGDDYLGRQITDSLNDEKVNTDNIIKRPSSHSQYAFIAAEKNGGRRTIFWRRPTGQPAQPEELNFDLIRKAQVFYTDGLFPDASIAAARAAKEAGQIVVVDAGTLRDGMLELATYCDYFIVSESFARAMVKGDDPYGACKELQNLGPGIVGVTLGDRGYLVLNQNEWIERPAYQVNAIDTTGCGDLFHAGITFGILKGWSLEKTLDFSAWAAASVSTHLGGRTGIPSIEAYEQRIIKSP
jgi:sulfofructose kinase